MKHSHFKSLKQALLVWLMLPLVCLALINAFFAYTSVVESANEAYDRSLYIAARTLAEETKLINGRLVADTPLSATYLFENNIGSSFFYEVIGFDGQRLAGNALLPNVPNHDKHPISYFSLVGFYDAKLQELPIRLAVLRHPVVERSDITHRARADGLITVKVAETLEARQLLVSHIFKELLMGQWLLLVALAGLIWVAIRNSLKPLEGLGKTLESRDDSDFRLVERQHLPSELQPLIDSLNRYLQRLTHLITLRKNFIANAAHQLRTPWAIVKTQVGLAQKEQPSGELGKIIEALSTTANHSVRLTDQLLLMTRAEHGYQIDMEKTVDFLALAKQVVIDYHAAADKVGIDLGVEALVPKLLIHGSEVLLYECLANLVDNAIRYCPAHQHSDGSGGRHITVRVEKNQVSVMDDGPGIPLEQQPKIFNRFFRGNNHSSGSGLGLAIVREIATQHGLEVSLQSPYYKQGNNNNDIQSGVKVILKRG